MPTEADIQNAASRIQNGEGVISTIMKMKKAAIEALKSGDTASLKKAGVNTFSFNASTI